MKARLGLLAEELVINTGAKTLKHRYADGVNILTATL